MTELYNDPKSQTIKTLCHAIELGTAILQKTSGNAVANSLGGETLPYNRLREVVAARLQQRLLTKETAT